MSNVIPPIIFVAYADPTGDSGDWNLPRLQLDQEATTIRDALAGSNGGQNGGWQFQTGADCKRADLIDHFSTNRVAVFHFAGHSNQQSLWLPSEAHGNQVVDGTLFEEYLATQHSLQLAFFNSCVNRDWTSKLMGSIPYVIATVCAVENDAALTFASSFYSALAAELSFDDAFSQATHAVMTEHENEPTIAQWIQQSGKQAPPVRMMDELADAPIDAPSGNGAIFPWVALKSRNAVERPWKLSDIAHDPLIGMPPLAPGDYDLPARPYVSLKGHTERDGAIFFGRSAEIRALYDWTLGSDGSHPVRLFYGQSGVGKSSLLNAGLFPRLNKKCRVAYRRRNRNLIEDLYSAIAEILGVTPPADVAAAGSDAWKAQLHAWLSSPDSSLVILDQVEEAITHKPVSAGQNENPAEDEIRAITDCVKQLFGAGPAGVGTAGTKARLLLSFRKEYLAEIRGCLSNGSADDSPGLVDHFWLDRLERDAILEVVTGAANSRLTRDTYKIAFPETTQASGDYVLPGMIADDLLKGDSPIATVLQIVLNQLWDAAKPDANGVRAYTTALYQGLSARGNPLLGFYRQQIDSLYARYPGENYEAGIELDLLFEHTTELDTSRRRSLAELRRKYPQIAQIEQLLTANKDIYLLTEPEGAPGAAETNAEESSTALAHDTLAPLIRRDFMHSTRPGARARRILENRTLDWDGSKKAGVLDSVELRTVEHGMDFMRALTDAERKLIKASRTERLRSAISVAVLCLLVFVVAFVLPLGWLYVKIQSLEQKEQAAVSASECNLNHSNEQIYAVAESLEAERLFRSGWLLHLDPTYKRGQVQKTVLGNLHRALTFREVYRSAIPMQAEFLGNCAMALDEKNHPLLTARGGVLYFGNEPIPADFVSQGISACDAASRTIVWMRNAPNLPSGVVQTLPDVFLWRSGKTRTISLPILGGPNAAANDFALKPGGSVLAFGLNSDGKFDRFDLYLLDLNTGALTQVRGRTASFGQKFSASGRYLLQPGIAAIDLSSPAAPVVSLSVNGGGFSTSLLDGQDAVTAFGANLLRVYRVSDGTHFDYLPANPGDFDQSVYFKDKNLFDAVLAPSGKILASDSTGNRIDLWAVPSSLQPLPAGWSSVDMNLVHSLRRESNLTSFPLHLDKFNLEGTPDDRHAFSRDSQFLVTIEFPAIPDGPSSHAENTTAYLHIWAVDPEAADAVSKAGQTESPFVTGCRRIGNFIDDMAGNSSMLDGSENIDYKALQKACARAER